MRKRRQSPQQAADACLRHAWRDDIDDNVRRVLERAHDTIENLMARCIATAKVLEVVETKLAAMKFPLLDDSDDPGMSL